MAKFDTAFAQRAFRRAGRVEVTAADGTVLSGRGVVSALRGEAAQAGGLRHDLGALSRPLCRFTGWLAGEEGLVGGELRQAGLRYRVLDCRPIPLGDRVAAVRCLLERKEASP